MVLFNASEHGLMPSLAQNLKELKYPNNGVGKFNQTPAVGKLKRYGTFESNVHNTKIMNSETRKYMFRYLVMSFSSSASTP